MRDTVTKLKATFFQPPEQQLVNMLGFSCLVRECIEICMFDFEFYQQTRRGVMI